MRGVRPWHQTPWDWRAAVQYICGGTGSGLLIFTALAALEDSAWLWRTGLLALAFIGVGLLFVWMKLGRRLRALYVFLNPRTSWMSREAFLSLPLLGFGFFGVVLGSSAIMLLAAVFGLAFMYAQARMLHASRGIPAWRETLMIPLIMATGLTEGAAVLLVATAVFTGVGSWLPITLWLLLLVRLGVWLAYRRKLSAPGAAPVHTVTVLNRANGPILWLGHVLPLVLLPLALLVPAPWGQLLLGPLAGLAALLGGWYLKFTLVARAAYNQGFAIAHTPARTPGYGGPGTKPGWN